MTHYDSALVYRRILSFQQSNWTEKDKTVSELV